MKKQIIIMKETVKFYFDKEQIIMTDCIGHQLFTGDLVSFGSSKNIYKIIKFDEKYYLHSVNSRNFQKESIFFLNKIKSKITPPFGIDLQKNRSIIPFDLEQKKIYKVFLLTIFC